MRRLSIGLLGLMALLSPGLADAAVNPEGLSVGFMLGSPTGLTLKDYMPNGNAWDVDVGLAAPGFRLNIDYLWTLARSSEPSGVNPSFYIGLGGMAGFVDGPCGVWHRFCDNENEAYGGVRVPIGVELALAKAPLVFGLEGAPGVVLGLGSAGFIFDLMLNVRFVL